MVDDISCSYLEHLDQEIALYDEFLWLAIDLARHNEEFIVALEQRRCTLQMKVERIHNALQYLHDKDSL